MFDSKLPPQLKSLQSWFASIITRGIDSASRIKPTAPSGKTIVEEAAKYISPSHSLLPWQRIQIYNQQYWWRLLDLLHENLPLATRLYGYQDFNELIATPYLEKYPPNDWSLNTLADRLPQWVTENYHEKDKEILHHALLIDIAFNRGFFAAQKIPLQPQDFSTKLLNTPLRLQPAITLFDLPYDLFTFRTEMLKEEDGDYFLNHPLPKLDRTPHTFIIYRDSSFNMRWDTLEPHTYLLLSRFEKGASIEEACHQIDHQLVEKNLMAWLKIWTANGWLVDGKNGIIH